MGFSISSRAIAALLIMLGVTSGNATIAQDTGVDLHLVLAVDVSWSMDSEEQRLQRDGYVEAFRDNQVIKAIQSGPTGRIAVTYFEWAGPDVHLLVAPWTVIDGPHAARRLADDLAQRPISRHRMTSISSALLYAQKLLADAPGRAPRRVVDVSGDGPNNAGPSPVTRVRDQLVGDGIVINGLPVMLKVGNAGPYSFGQDIADLDIYYARCVIGGPGSFMIPIRTVDEFAIATRQKLLQEISGLDLPHLRHAQFAPGTAAPGGADYDCEIGERNWRLYFENRGRF